MIVYRIQDKAGRGPWKPGFSHKWVEDRDDLDNLPPWYVEFGPIHTRAYTWESVGSACRTVDQLRRWFTRSEYETLIRYGYQAVKMETSRILAASDIQCVFTRSNKPLNCDLEVFDLYGNGAVAHGDCPGGPIDRKGIELEEPEKGHAFDEMWGITKRG